MTVAAINRSTSRARPSSRPQQVRDVMAMIFPEAVTLVREAREGLSA